LTDAGAWLISSAGVPAPPSLVCGLLVVISVP
jgi:hypothetical protein